MKNLSQWSSSIGFVLASAGSAIGIGAVWKFPYMAGTYGGGAFLLIFIIFTLLVGLPLLLSDFVLGRYGRTYSTNIFKKVSGKSSWNLVGWLGNLTVFVLFSFYSVIGGWIILYIIRTLLDSFGLTQSHNYGNIFNDYISNPFYSLASQFAFILFTVVIVSKGVEKGIEKASKVMMPLLFISFVIVIIRSITLDGALDGIQYFLQPKVSDLSAEGILYALGQSFFALSLGTCGMMTYASYLDHKTNIVKSANAIVWMNIAVSIAAGLAIFPAIFAFGLEPNQGPGLLFIVLPQVFDQMFVGQLFYLLFLILFLFAAITSSISLLELNISNITKNNNDNRKKWSYIIGILVFIFGIPSSLSNGLLQDFTFGVGTFFDNMDYLVANILMPIGALGVTIFVGHIFNKEIIMKELNMSDTKKGRLFVNTWYFLVKFVLPIIIIAVFIGQLI
ncbi:sodium-dependent transporter [Mammaliicoccus sciuri]|uniref:sodium-dependent transporter n=1 Tax=Mammaliicoccus sciuri TaxID=1296 RepID=UPI001914003D|nr:sodium-dependent transporter [Mammaliicoccus sciuri]MCD8824270.1 sodium-dependent transporter [Mammaliicoccus sciuri]QQQ10262.1 sodium-dependent transporter [Mammaliicoccus sciuri]